MTKTKGLDSSLIILLLVAFGFGFWGSIEVGRWDVGQQRKEIGHSVLCPATNVGKLASFERTVLMIPTWDLRN